MQLLPDYLMAMSRSGHDVATVLAIGAEAAARATSSTAAVLVHQGGGVRLAALHDSDPDRQEVVAAALAEVDLDGADSPFDTALGSGQNALLAVGQLAVARPGPAWAASLDRAGLAFLGLTPLVARERTLGVLVTARLAADPAPTTRDLAAQAQVAAHLATFVDNATALAHMRQSSLVVDAMPDAIIGFSRDREVILWNHGAEQMYGIPEAEALGQRLDDLISNEYGPAARGMSGPAISLINKGSWTGRVRQRTRDGRVLHADVALASIVEDGILRGAVSINRDVSELVKAEAQRAEDERRMQALLDASRALTAVFDQDGRVVAVNAEWAAHIALGGLRPEEVGVGCDYIAALRRAAAASDDAAAVLAGIEAVLAGRSSSFEWDYDTTDPDGSIRAYMVAVARMPGEQGGAFATHTDITTRQVMESPLAHQATKTSSAITITAGTKMAETLSAKA